MWRLAANTLITSRGQPIRYGLPAWGLGEGLTTPHHRKPASYKMYRASDLDGFFRTAYAMENEYEILEHGTLKESLQGRFTGNIIRRSSKA
jgi:hypothetical protein